MKIDDKPDSHYTPPESSLSTGGVMIPFSELTARFASFSTNRFTDVVARRKASGEPVIDLVNPNWYENGIAFPDEILDEAYRLALTQTRIYNPNAHGNPALREAIARWYARRGEMVNPDSIFITPGSSLAYLLLFRLLGDRSEALCPQPSYPLFEDIAAVAGWRVTNYPLESAQGWRIDSERLANRVSNDTRAICLVSPHNPTGAIISVPELSAIGEVSQRLNIPVLFDEVFCEFRSPLETGQAGMPVPRFMRPQEKDFPLVFIINGFSKLFALPGHKIGWIIVRGNDKTAVSKSITTLDYLLDTFLPVSEVAQSMAAIMLAKDNGAIVDSVSRGLCERLARRRELVSVLAVKASIKVQQPEGGVYSIVDLPSHISSEQFVVELVEQTGIVVHPGYFYDLPHEAIVFTFLAREEVLREALPVVFEKVFDLK